MSNIGGVVSSNWWSGGKVAGAVSVAINQPSNHPIIHPFFFVKIW
ncbi:MAG: hypothetical protein ACE5D0_08105 [Fidelibacterota bacterium]